jgi:hypothetical protein
MTTLDVDVLSVRKIYAKGNNNSILAANTVLTTDGLGGTTWTSLSSIGAGLSFNTFTTSASTFTSSPGNTQFSILDNSNIGLIPVTAGGAAATLYSKSFGQINVPGQNSINSFNTTTGQFNNTISISGAGVLTVSTNTATNQLFLFSPNDAISSMSSLIRNMNAVNTTMTSAITSFNSPFSTFIYTALSSFSTALGPTMTPTQITSSFSSFSTALGSTVKVPELNTSLSTFSTALGPTITTQTFTSSLSTATTASFFTNTLNTSTINISGNRQPFIQYGSGSLLATSTLITLNRPYVNSNYIIQLTYNTRANTLFVPLSFSSMTTSNFLVRGDINATTFHWTTYGNLF